METSKQEYRKHYLQKPSHINHPSAVWVRESVANYVWLYNLFEKLCDEYTFRYGKIHSTDSLLRDLLISPPRNIKWGGLTTMPQTMPDHCKKPDLVDNVQNLLHTREKRFAKWTKRDVPEWFEPHERI